MVLCKQEFSQEAVGGYARCNFSRVLGTQRSMQTVYDLTCSLRMLHTGFPGLICFFTFLAQQSVVQHRLSSLSSWI